MKGRITWAQRIGGALQHDGFTLLAQPIVDLSTGRREPVRAAAADAR
jgi:EAL domain-containing protein (putative c-di-GMP-specific phosphodiesterase class I)